MTEPLSLYTYYRSSTAYRVRIALNFKGLSYQSIPVHLLHEGGEQFQPAFCQKNPSCAVPVLASEGAYLTQSLAILEYLEEIHPIPSLLPADPLGRARVRALAQIIACDIHPLDNLDVLHYLEHTLLLDKAARLAWYRHWVHQGLSAFEQRLTQSAATGLCCHGDTPTLADCCLVPQVYNARRFDCPLDEMPTLTRIAEYCAVLPAFTAAAPERQIDMPARREGTAGAAYRVKPRLFMY